jgi:hypothetical protein
LLFTLAIYIGRGLNEHNLFISIKLYYVKLKSHPYRMTLANMLKHINIIYNTFCFVKLKTLHVGELRKIQSLKWGLSISDALIIVLLFLIVNKIDPSFIDGSYYLFEYNNFKRIWKTNYINNLSYDILFVNYLPNLLHLL